MTVSTTENVATYIGNGSTTNFPFDFRVIEATHLTVSRLVIATGLVDLVYDPSDYTINGLGDAAGGSVDLLVAAVSSAYKIVLERIVPYTQELDLVNQGGFFPDTVEAQLDVIVMSIQQIKEEVTRSIKLAPGETADALIAGAARADQVISFDGTGDVILSDTNILRGPPGGNISAIGLFSALYNMPDIPAGTDVLMTSGYNATGKGAGSYVSDSVANAGLMAAHPRFCTVDADGRYWRLMPDADGAIAFEQGGAVGDAATNDQVACQSTITYANAVGITGVRGHNEEYDLWNPTRTLSYVTDPYNGQGMYLYTRQNLRFLPGASGWYKFTCLNSTGGTNDTVTQTVDGNPHRGAGFYAWPLTTIDFIDMGGVEFDGTRTYTVGSTPVDLTHKGFRAQDATVLKIFADGLTMRNFAGEIWYSGALPTCHEELHNCLFENSPQSAMNPNGGTGLYVNVRAGNSPIGAEALSGKGRRFVDCQFYKCTASCTFIGGAAGDGSFHSGYSYSYPWRETDRDPPWIEFDNCTFDGVALVNLLGSYFKGNYTAVDSPTDLTSTGKQESIFLDIQYVADRATKTYALSITSQAPTLTTQIPSAPVGIYYATSRNIKVNIDVQRTDNAVVGGFKVQRMLRFYRTLFDAAKCTFTLSGEADVAVDSVGTYPASGFVWPRVNILWNKFVFSGSDPNEAFVSGSFNLAMMPGANWVQPTAAGTHVMTLTNPYPFVEGQINRIIHNGGAAQTDRHFSLAKSGAGALNPQDRVMYQRADFIEMRWANSDTAFVETNYVTQQPYESNVTLADGATVTPDFGLGKDFEWTIGGNRTLANPLRKTTGKTGKITIKQDATGTRVITYGTDWKFPGGAAVGGVLSVAANAVDEIKYTVHSDGTINCVLSRAFAS